jgi:sec-independent protein translocase protein TatA
LFANKKEGIMNDIMLAIGGFGPQEMLLIVLVVFLLFGATKLPQLAKAIGQSKRAFKQGLEEGEKEAQKDDKEK